MRTCPSCSKPVPGGALSCPACGAALVDSATPTRMPRAEDNSEQRAASFRSTSASPSTREGRFVTGSILAGRYRIVIVLRIAIVSAVFLLLVLFLLRTLLRRQWLAAGICILIFPLINAQTGYLPTVSVPLIVLYAAILVILVLRCGLVALIAAEIANYLLRAFPITLNFSAWYVGSGMVALVAVLAMAVYGFRTSLGGQKVFKGKLLEE